MNIQRRTRLNVIFSLIVAYLLMLVPMPQVLVAWKPYWIALVVIYWVLEDNRHIGLGRAFLLGLGADLLVGGLLGEQALRLVVLTFIAARFRSRLRFFPMWQQTLAVLVLLVNDRVLLLMIRAFAGQPWPPLDYWFAPLAGAILWPFLFLLLDALRVRVRVSE